jgi:hypothetical protein
MIFVVGGIPDRLFNRFQQLVLKIFDKGNLIVAKPLRAGKDGKFLPSPEYAQTLLRDLSSRIAEKPDIAVNGCAAIIFASPGVQFQDCVNSFRPFALTLTIDLPIPTLTEGDSGRQTMNRMVELMRMHLPSLRNSIKAMNTELRTRKNRTPLLLPYRNFSSDVFGQELEALQSSLARSKNPSDRISAACARIEHVHPFRRGGGSCFFDAKGVRFKMPGRAVHGNCQVVGDGHLPNCLLSAHLRLGGHSLSGFHYDCTAGENGKLEGERPNCHGAMEHKSGRPHINIYANDFLR